MLKKILVVDDSALILQMYKMVLIRYQCTIVVAKNGQEALHMIAKNPDTNLALVDINMPVMNGLEFLKKVKESGAYDHIPIVIVSTEGKEEDTRRGISLGAAGYVTKPVQPSELHTLIEKICPSI
jgi:two-component system chemotaxis response regulator CheY